MGTLQALIYKKERKENVLLLMALLVVNERTKRFTLNADQNMAK